jgi:hypothetical protein
MFRQRIGFRPAKVNVQSAVPSVRRMQAEVIARLAFERAIAFFGTVVVTVRSPFAVSGSSLPPQPAARARDASTTQEALSTRGS